MSTKPRCKHLVLDAGPLLSLSPLRGLAENYYTTPQVLDELKDKKAREHLQQLGLVHGVNIIVKSPDNTSLAHGAFDLNQDEITRCNRYPVIQWAKKTGDYNVLSHSDLCVLALTYSLHEEQGNQHTAKTNTNEACGEWPPIINKADSITTEDSEVKTTVDDITEQLRSTSLAHESTVSDENGAELRSPLQEGQLEEQELHNGSVTDKEEATEEASEPLNVERHAIEAEEQPIPALSPGSQVFQLPPTPIFEDPLDGDDGEGEWITPDNVSLYKSRALNLLPSDGNGKQTEDEEIWAGCMTADFAMQNVSLHIGLNLVGLEGKRIEKIKTWVLRCHACFKLCKDNSKKFCPSCGNPTLIRASVTVARPGADPNSPALQVHLKKNFQYRLRGTKYSIPAPKPGSAKTGPGEGLILREDQAEYMRAQKRAESKREREEARIFKGMVNQAANNASTVGVLSSWMDPDWVPELITTGTGGKGRTTKNSRMDGELPQIGYGKKNPNERKRRR
ncbi:hypothetical protein AMATHDRAFT_47177 [Amanita thiersii Skay4041]|uniref:20S-pre-rRNA D-site endonuclease NOB1 n=1 Tax=Amanita thiersii Skay4041 TaxID=703135 RepID=A0A2A9NPP1_9AGAR|nr:hypothetical protein AMATHDRAFT_47177 [Amanita thiersii Skay4041]